MAERNCPHQVNNRHYDSKNQTIWCSSCGMTIGFSHERYSPCVKLSTDSTLKFDKDKKCYVEIPSSGLGWSNADRNLVRTRASALKKPAVRVKLTAALGAAVDRHGTLAAQVRPTPPAADLQDTLAPPVHLSATHGAAADQQEILAPRVQLSATHDAAAAADRHGILASRVQLSAIHGDAVDRHGTLAAQVRPFIPAADLQDTLAPRVHLSATHGAAADQQNTSSAPAKLLAPHGAATDLLSSDPAEGCTVQHVAHNIPRVKGSKVKVKNLTEAVTAKQLEEVFVKYGMVKIVKKQDRHAFLVFEHHEDAARAVENGVSLNGVHLNLSFSGGYSRE